MILNSNNIEKWFFDYFEGELTVLERKEVEQFVLNNPEYQADFQSWTEAYSASNDSEIPAYIAPANLFAKIAFYETASFKIAASIISIISLSALGIWSFEKLSFNTQTADVNYEQKEYFSEVFQRFSYNKLTQIDENKAYTNTQTSNINVADYESTVHQPTKYNKNAAIPNEIISNDNGVHFDFTTNKNTSDSKQTTHLITWSSSEDELTLKKLPLVKESKLKTDHFAINQLSKSDDYHLKFISKRNDYKFLDFRNSSVRGVNASIKDDRIKSTNIAEISETEQQRTHTNTKKSFIDKLKKIDLGLMNINDPIFEIANYQPLTLNPSLSGQLGFTRLKSQYRSQWINTNHTIQLTSLSLDSYINKLKAGILLNAQTLFFNTNAKATTLSFAYSQKFELSKEQSLAATIEYTLSIISSPQPFTESLELTPGTITPASKLNQLSQKDVWHNIGVSSLYNGKYFYGGVNITNILGNNISTSEKNGVLSHLNYSVQLGTDYKKSFYSNFVIAPYIVFNKFGDRKECWFGTSVRYKGLIAGLSASSALSSKVYVGVQSSKFRLVYGYDLNKKNLELNNYIGNHEISLRILFGSKYNNWSR